MTVKIAIATQKGGVGRTTSALNISHKVASEGYKTLMIDLDSQASLSAIHIKETIERSLFDLLEGQGKPGDYITEIKDNLFLLPSDSRLARIEGKKESILRDTMAGARGFDFIVLDCPPSLGFMTTAALVYADYVIIPVKTDYLSLQGLVKINLLIDIVREDKNLNPGLKILGYLPCQYDQRRVLDRQVLEVLRTRFKTIFEPIRINVNLSESVSWGESIFEYRKHSRGAQDYRKLIKAILKGVSNAKKRPR